MRCWAHIRGSSDTVCVTSIYLSNFFSTDRGFIELTTMVEIRQGKLSDCKDLLTVYQTTRWYYLERENGYTTVEDVKAEHQLLGFKNWGWLVAEKDGIVIGEIVFRVEKNPVAGRIGIIRSLDVDVRHQKTTIGTQLTRAAEKTLKEKRAARVVSISPPEAYNFWMKVEYFARGSLVNINVNPERVKKVSPKGMKPFEIKNLDKLPKSMEFSNLAVPGLIVEMINQIKMKQSSGKLYEFYQSDALIGIGALRRVTPKLAEFVIDCTLLGKTHFGFLVDKIATAAIRLGVKKIMSKIPKDQVDLYRSVGRWSFEDAREIPVTRLL